MTICQIPGWVISTHAPRTGSDPHPPPFRRRNPPFQPTLPARGATPSLIVTDAVLGISTHAPRTGSDTAECSSKARTAAISTHAPRTGSDGREVRPRCTGQNFNPRSPHGERHSSEIACIDLCKGFQPTLPARGATWTRWAAYSTAGNFNPRSPHGERRAADDQRVAAVGISTHAPRTGSDIPANGNRENLFHFNPRSPHGERRGRNADVDGQGHFNPRSPHGERRAQGVEQVNHLVISTHAPRTGSDKADHTFRYVWLLFQPTLPARGATCTGKSGA